MIGLVYPDELLTVYRDVKLLVFLPTEEEIVKNKMEQKSFCFGIDFKDSEFWEHIIRA